MKFAVYAIWDHGSPISTELVGRVSESLPPDGVPCVWVRPEDDSQLTLGLDVEAPDYDDAIEFTRGVLERAVFGNLEGQVIEISSMDQIGQKTWSVMNSSTPRDNS